MTKEKINEYTLRITQSSKSELIVVLYDLAIENLNEALDCYESSHDDYRSACFKASRVVADLMGALDYSYELAQPLFRVYEYISKVISIAVVKNDVKGIEDCIRYLGKLRESFAQVAKQDTTGPVMANAHEVYAGLTYGKGVLNESVTASSNRGYTV